MTKLDPDYLTKASDIEEWLFNFNVVSTANGWDEVRQSAVLPAFFRDDALDEYKKTPFVNDAPSKKKYEQILGMVRNLRKSSEELSILYDRFSDAVLLPGQNVKTFAMHLEKLLRQSRPSMATDDIKFMVFKKIVSSLPENVSFQLTLLGCDDIETLCNKANILMSKQSRNPSKTLALITDGKNVEEKSLDASSDSVLCSSVIQRGKNDAMELSRKIEMLEKKIEALTLARNVRTQFHGDQKSIPCQRCGLRGHTSNECRGTVICRKCKEAGHIERLCGMKLNANLSNLHYSSSCFNDFSSIPLIDVFCETIGKKCKALIDTGSCISLIRSDLQNFQNVTRPDISLRSVKGDSIELIGKTPINLKINKTRYFIDAYISGNLPFDLIIGRDFLIKYKFIVDLDDPRLLKRKYCNLMMSSHYDISHELSEDQRADILKILDENKEVFAENVDDIGSSDQILHTIETNSERPLSSKPFRVPIHLRQEMESQLSKMLRMGIIRPSNSPWSSPSLLVKKKDGTHRFCVDYRKLNDVTIRDKYPLPSIEEYFDKLNDAKYFSVLDLQSGYWQCKIDEKSKEKTAFTPWAGAGLFEFNVLPFGLCNAPATFQRLLDRLLSTTSNCIAYIDDILIFSNSLDEHLKQIRSILSIFVDSGFKLNMKKCHFGYKEVEYLGMIVNGEGVRPSKKNVEAITNYPVPSNVKELHSFLGSCNYFQRYIKGFAQIANPLYELLKKDSIWIWSNSHQDAFEKLKNSLENTCLLRHPTSENKFILTCDASDVAIGAVLSQIFNGNEYPVAFASQKLNTRQKKYSVIDRECLALVWAVQKFRHYLYGKAFDLVTDHNPLTHLRSMKDPKGRRGRWIMELENYDYNIKYKPGKMNVVADAMSRYSCSTSVSSELDLTKEQQLDSSIRFVIENLDKDQTLNVSSLSPDQLKLWKSRSNLCVYNNILFNTGRRGLRPVLPKHLRQDLFYDLHNNSLGHFGVAKTLEAIRQRVFWPDQDIDIKKWINECNTCSLIKNKNYTPKAALVPIKSFKRFDFWEIDFTGPLPITKNANRYIIIFIDHCTKWVEALAVPDQTAETAAKALFSCVVSRFGVPSRIHSDQGTQFESQVFHGLCSLLNIKKSRTTPYHPMGNGLAEKTVKNVKEIISSYVNEFQDNWDEFIDPALFALRVATHSSTKYSPGELVYGQRLILPADFTLGLKDELVKKTSYHVLVEDLKGKILTALNIVNKSIDNQKRQEIFYNKKLKEIFHNQGDLVLMKRKNFAKLQPRFEGPYKIIENMHPNYLIESTISPYTSKRVHVNLLYPCKRMSTGPHPSNSHTGTADTQTKENSQYSILRRSTRVRKRPNFSIYKP